MLALSNNKERKKKSSLTQNTTHMTNSLFLLSKSTAQAHTVVQHLVGLVLSVSKEQKKICGDLHNVILVGAQILHNKFPPF